jgi:beta-glucosidase
MPFTIAENLEDYPPHHLGIYNTLNKEDVVYEEDIFIGYRWMDKYNTEVAYPFGYGLSYTSFHLGEPRISASSIRSVQEVVAADVQSVSKKGRMLKVRVPVTNTGDSFGAEIVQLYLRDVESSIPRPDKELKGFKKIWLNPGQTETVEFMISEDDLRFFDPVRHAWVSEKGKYEILLGTSAADIMYTLDFDLK